jgi:hypothetical protein
MVNEYRQPIIVDINDLYGFQRKAEYIHLIDDFNNKTTTVRVRIRWYQDGVEINDNRRNITPYEREIIADNTTLADMTTGLPVMTMEEFKSQYQIVTQETDPETGETTRVVTWREDTPTTYMGESDFYCYVRDNVPVILKDLIQGSIIRANQRGNL